MQVRPLATALALVAGATAFAAPSGPASIQLMKVAESLSSRGRGLAGRMLNLSPR